MHSPFVSYILLRLIICVVLVPFLVKVQVAGLFVFSLAALVQQAQLCATLPFLSFPFVSFSCFLSSSGNLHGVVVELRFPLSTVSWGTNLAILLV